MRLASAQESPQGETATLAPVIVTATLQKTTLQDTPVAVTAITSTDLQNLGLSDIRNVSAQTPGLVIGGPAQLGTNPVTIRGIGQLPQGIGADDSVAIYLDGVYLGRAYSDVFDFVDVQRVEVLRGPQGTLYGRNATGGAISIVTEDPTDTPTAYADARFTDLDSYRIRALASGPLGAPTLSGLAAFSVSTKDGYVINRYNGRPELGEHSQTGAVKLRYAPSSEFDITLAADANIFRIDEQSKLLIEANPDPYSLAANFPGTEWRQSRGLSLTVNAHLSWATLTSISAYRTADMSQLFDSDSTAQEILRLDPIDERENQVSQEFRLASPASLRFSWIAGLYYFRERAWSYASLPFTFPFGVSDLILGANNTTNSYAGFFNATFSATRALSLTAGVRYTRETKEFLFGQVDAGAPAFANVPTNESEIKANAITPRFVIQYKLSPDVMTYVSANRGFKSGGFAAYNPLPTPTSTPTPFQPEHIWDYEIGLKNELLNHRLRLDLDAFYYDYTDLQVRTPDQYGFTVIKNAATADINGVEAEFEWRPVAALELSGNAAYLNARYKQFAFEQAGVLVDLSGKRLLQAPEWKGALNAQYTVPLGSGSVTFLGEYSYEGRVYYEYTNTPIYGHPALDLYNARVTYRTPDDRSYLTIFGNNLTAKTYYTMVLQVLGNPIGFPNPPREFGFEIGTKF